MNINSEIAKIKTEQRGEDVRDSIVSALQKLSEQTSLIPKNITKNGTFYPSDDGADGYSPVIVNVAGGAEKESVDVVAIRDIHCTHNFKTGEYSTSINNKTGDMLVAFVVCREKITIPNGWNVLAEAIPTNSKQNSWLLYKIADKAGESISINPASSIENYILIIAVCGNIKTPVVEKVTMDSATALSAIWESSFDEPCVYFIEQNYWGNGYYWKANISGLICISSNTPKDFNSEDDYKNTDTEHDRAALFIPAESSGNLEIKYTDGTTNTDYTKTGSLYRVYFTENKENILVPVNKLYRATENWS